jgi:hypothetical protein
MGFLPVSVNHGRDFAFSIEHIFSLTHQAAPESYHNANQS